MHSRESRESALQMLADKMSQVHKLNPNSGHGAGPRTRDVANLLIAEDVMLGILLQTQCRESCIQLHARQKCPFWVTATSAEAPTATCHHACPRNKCLHDPLIPFPLSKESSAFSSFGQFLYLFSQCVHGMGLELTAPWKGAPK